MTALNRPKLRFHVQSVGPRVGRGLTEIDELFYREWRGVELRVEVQHLGDVAETVSCELHSAACR